MKLETVDLEDYIKLSTQELRTEIANVHMELTRIKDEEESDDKLQAAISLANSLKIQYTMRRKQQQALLKTLQKILSMTR